MEIIKTERDHSKFYVEGCMYVKKIAKKDWIM